MSRISEMSGWSRTLSMTALVVVLTCALGACYSSAKADSLLVAGYDIGKVEQFALDGTYTGTFAARNGCVGVLQGADGCVYVGGLNGVSKYAANGTLINENFITGPTFVTDLAWHNDKLWLTDFYGSTAAYDPTTGLQSGPSTTLGGNPYSLKFGPDGRAYVVTWSTGELLAWDTVANTTEQIWAPGGNLGSLAWNGSDLYISRNDLAMVYKWTIGTSLPEATNYWATGSASGLGITTFDGKLYRAAANPSELNIYSLADASVLYSGPCSNTSQAQQICVVVPEPSSLLALLAGGAGLCTQMIRRRKS